MTTSENENDHFDLDHFDRVICKKRVNVFCPRRMNPKSPVDSMLWTVTNPTRMSAPRARRQQPRQRDGCLSIGMKMKNSGRSTKAANQ